MSPKKSTEDIIVPQRKSKLPRKEITISLSNRKKSDGGSDRESPRETKKEPQSRGVRTPRNPKTIYAVGVALVVVAAVGSVAWLFGGVEVVVAPREESAQFEGSFLAYASTDTSTTAKDPSVLVYTNQIFTRQASEVVPATEKKQVEERATGKITIYNDFSASPQRLIKNTRFETPDGLIFRITNSVDVPGQKTVGGAKQPGSVEATVFADEAGDKYNIGASQFTIPGFKGKPQYQKFYARSADPMTGGFVGERLVADTAKIEEARARLHEKLTTNLTEAAVAEAPPHSIRIRSLPIEFESSPLADGNGGVTVTENAKQVGAFVDHSLFASIAARAALPDYDGQAVSFKEPFGFTITTTPKSTPEEPETATSNTIVNVSLNGTINFVWDFDKEMLRRDLAGHKTTEMDTIMKSKHPGISHAEAKFWPFCIRCVFPADPGKIKMTSENGSVGKQNNSI